MLIITFHNDGTGDEIKGNYDVSVFINKNKIWNGRVEDHYRAMGWQGLVKDLLTNSELGLCGVGGGG